MESFVWDVNFLTGIKQIDKQHHHIVNMINEFSELLASNDLCFDEMDAILGQLNDYADYHFMEEEAVMKNAGIHSLHLNHHVVLHRDFLNDLKSIQENLSGDSLNSSKELLHFLINWLAYHILGIDKNMARQIAAIESGSTPWDAYQAEQNTAVSSIEPLVATLRSLFKQLSKKNKALKALNFSLEEKVALRTEELLIANQHLEVLSSTDALTGLPNRRKAMCCLSSLWDESITKDLPLVCMMVDIDYFKQINDIYGHDMGDKVLITIANTLKHALRNDDIVCRLGGDEFLVICPNTDFDGALSVAELMRQKVSDLIIDMGEISCGGSISIGVASREANLNNFEALIKLSDQGLYKSKQKGKNCVSFISSGTC